MFGFTQKYPVNDKVNDGGDGGVTVVEHEHEGKTYKFDAAVEDGGVVLSPKEDYPELKDEALRIKVSKEIQKEYNKAQDTNRKLNQATQQNQNYEQQLAEMNGKLDEQRKLMSQLNNGTTAKVKTQPETDKFDHRAELLKAANVADLDDFQDLEEGAKEDARFIVQQKQMEFFEKKRNSGITELFNNRFNEQEALNKMSAKLSGTGHTLAEAQAWIVSQSLPINDSSLKYFLLSHQKSNKPDPIDRSNRIVTLFDSIPDDIKAKGDIGVKIKKKEDSITQQRNAIIAGL